MSHRHAYEYNFTTLPPSFPAATSGQ